PFTAPVTRVLSFSGGGGYSPRERRKRAIRSSRYFSHCSRVVILDHPSRLRALASAVRRLMSRSIIPAAALRCSLLSTSGTTLLLSAASSAVASGARPTSIPALSTQAYRRRGVDL